MQVITLFKLNILESKIKNVTEQLKKVVKEYLPPNGKLAQGTSYFILKSQGLEVNLPFCE